MKPKLEWATPTGRFSLDFNRPLIMSIINLTPDSFSDGGRFDSADAAVLAAAKDIVDGADILDLGAESSRPGAAPLSEADEWARLEPVLRGLAKSGAPISVDSYKAGIAEKAILAGAAVINDIYAGRKEPEIFEVAAKHGVPIVLMHMQGEPGSMQDDPRYDDVVSEVRDFLAERARAAERAGVAADKIWLDPGIGFGKKPEHNLALIRRFDEAMPRGYRSVMALSRKWFLGKILGGAAPEARDHASAVAGAIAVMKGANIVRAHNVPLTREALAVAAAILRAAV